jgi:cytochrome c oxidase subunit IV
MSDHVSTRTYYLIFAALIVGTILTVWVAFYDLGIFNPIVALLIATVKAVLVVLFFMHVKYSSRLTKVTVVAGLFWFMILIGLTLSDYLTRAMLGFSD